MSSSLFRTPNHVTFRSQRKMVLDFSRLPPRDTGVPNSRCDHGDDLGHANESLSDRLNLTPDARSIRHITLLLYVMIALTNMRVDF
jgi:hypothetical protein